MDMSHWYQLHGEVKLNMRKVLQNLGLRCSAEANCKYHELFPNQECKSKVVIEQLRALSEGAYRR